MELRHKPSPASNMQPSDQLLHRPLPTSALRWTLILLEFSTSEALGFLNIFRLVSRAHSTLSGLPYKLDRTLFFLLTSPALLGWSHCSCRTRELSGAFRAERNNSEVNFLPEFLHFLCLCVFHRVDIKVRKHCMGRMVYEAFTNRRSKVIGAKVCEFPTFKIPSNVTFYFTSVDLDSCSALYSFYCSCLSVFYRYTTAVCRFWGHG